MPPRTHNSAITHRFVVAGTAAAAATTLLAWAMWLALSGVSRGATATIWLSWAMAFAAVLLAAYAVIVGREASRLRRRERMLAEPNRCPSCGYDVGEPIDGRRTCPECGNQVQIVRDFAAPDVPLPTGVSVDDRGKPVMTADGRDPVRTAVGVGCLVIGIAVTIDVAWMLLSFPRRTPWLIPLIPAGLVMLIVLAAAPRSIRRRSPDACGQCGYDLTSQPTELDECRVCPECGAAWRKKAVPSSPARNST